MATVLLPLVQNIEVHDLWLADCFIDPNSRDMHFVRSPTQGGSYKVHAETMTRKLVAYHLYQLKRDALAWVMKMGAIQ